MRYRLPLILSLLALLPVAALAQTVAQRTAGSILLQVQAHGEAWYVDPVTLSRTYMQDGAAAFTIMRSFGLGITDNDLATIPTASGVDQIQKANSVCAWHALARRLTGRILLQVQQHGEAWYIYPKNCYRIYLADGPSAYSIMRFLGLGISDADLALIPQGNVSNPPVSQPVATAWAHTVETVKTERGNFVADVVRMKRDQFLMMVDVAQLSDTPNQTSCEGGCARWPLQSYVQKNNGLIGIHGTYFCPPDYADCAGKAGEFLEPLVDTDTQVTINPQKMVFHFGPMLVQDTDLGLHFFHRTKDFASIANFEATTGKSLYSAISNYPSLIENGQNVVLGETMDDKQKTALTPRGGIGYNDTDIILVIAHSATVIDLASIFQALDARYALNLDGGGSAALYVDGSYAFGPGRDLPNALIFRLKNS